MSRAGKTAVCVLALAGLFWAGGCVPGGAFGEEFDEFFWQTMEETAITIGDYLVEQAVTNAFD